MDILMDVLKDKTKLIKFLLDTIQSCEVDKNGLEKFSECLVRPEPNLKPENLAKCIHTTMKITAKQAHQIQNLAIIALIQCQSNSFDTDVAMMMNKMGRGAEAIQQMFKNKLNGK